MTAVAGIWRRRSGSGSFSCSIRSTGGWADESLVGDLHAGRRDRLINLALSGFLCGMLWEFRNYWSRAKWHYTVPIMENLKIFEMPLPGYFGFPAFALECFTMYVFVRHVRRCSRAARTRATRRGMTCDSARRVAGP